MHTRVLNKSRKRQTDPNRRKNYFDRFRLKISLYIINVNDQCVWLPRDRLASENGLSIERHEKEMKIIEGKYFHLNNEMNVKVMHRKYNNLEFICNSWWSIGKRTNKINNYIFIIIYFSPPFEAWIIGRYYCCYCWWWWWC